MALRLALRRSREPSKTAQTGYSIAISLAANALGHGCYYASLTGGDDIFVKSRFGMIFVLLILSVLFYSFTLASIARLELALWARIFLEINAVIGIYKMTTYDLGTDFVHHGEYNFIMFIFLSAAAGILFTLLYLLFATQCWKGRPSPRTLGGFLALVLASIFFLRLYAMDTYVTGLFHRRLSPDYRKCNLQVTVPWIDFMPRRTLSFFTGSEDCPSTTRFASLVNGTLTMHCPPGTQARYIENPDFISLREKFTEYEEGNARETQQMLSMWNRTQIQHTEHEYTAPVKVDSVSGDTEGSYLDRNTMENYLLQNLVDPTLLARGKPPTSEHPNVLLVMVDALSRAHFYRRLRRTVELMESDELAQHHTAFQFFRYHALACCTAGNLMPMMTGYPEDYPLEKRKKAENFFWRQYPDHGYVTIWQNSLCQDYFAMFWNTTGTEAELDLEVVLPFCHPEYTPYKGTYSNLRGPYSLSRRCITGKHVHEYAFNHVNDFFDNYRDVRKLAIAIQIEAHEGSGSVIQSVDDDLAEFLKGIAERHPHTVVVLVADHGLHMGPFAVSSPGLAEQRLPSLFFLMPNSFLRRFPEVEANLRGNEQTLLSHMDLYRTLLQLPNYPHYIETGGYPIRVVDQNPHRNPQGFLRAHKRDLMFTPSSLLTTVPPRSCLEAGIETHCQCLP